MYSDTNTCMLPPDYACRTLGWARRGLTRTHPPQGTKWRCPAHTHNLYSTSSMDRTSAWLGFCFKNKRTECIALYELCQTFDQSDQRSLKFSLYNKKEHWCQHNIMWGVMLWHGIPCWVGIGSRITSCHDKFCFLTKYACHTIHPVLKNKFVCVPGVSSSIAKTRWRRAPGETISMSRPTLRVRVCRRPPLSPSPVKINLNHLTLQFRVSIRLILGT